MEIVRVDTKVDYDGELYISSDIDNWEELHKREITVVVDVDGSLDDVPTEPEDLLYIYFPFEDDCLPDREKLHGVAVLIATLARHEKILVHCSLGYNRSCLVMGLALTYLGISGVKALEHLQTIRPGALYNPIYAAYLESTPASSIGGGHGPLAETDDWHRDGI
ncbi:MAG: dual specificity protein phosphatase family protein [bacterium]|nr:dual specificity protein phosphatase family protein [bacterium]